MPSVMCTIRLILQPDRKESFVDYTEDDRKAFRSLAAPVLNADVSPVLRRKLRKSGSSKKSYETIPLPSSDLQDIANKLDARMKDRLGENYSTKVTDASQKDLTEHYYFYCWDGNEEICYHVYPLYKKVGAGWDRIRVTPSGSVEGYIAVLLEFVVPDSSLSDDDH